MALKIHDVKKMNAAGLKRQVSFQIDFDASYPTGGEALDTAIAGIGIKSPDVVLVGNSGVYWFQYDYTNKKVLAYTAGGDGAAQVANTTDLSAVTNVRVFVVGE